MNSEFELRYSVRLEVRATTDSAQGQYAEVDRDHLMELHEILQSEEQVGNALGDEIRFNLCPDCYGKMIQNPAGSESRVEFNFSDN